MALASVPTSKMYPLTIDIYYHTNAVGPDGSYTPTYSVLPDLSRVPCSLSYKSASTLRTRMRIELDRITEFRYYEILIPLDPFLSPRDKLIYVDLSKTQHILFVESYNDTDGLGIHWTVEATEKL